MNTASFEALPHLTANLSLSGLSWDMAAVVFVAIAVFVFGLSLGRDRLIAVLLAVYAAAIIARTIPDAFVFVANSNIPMNPIWQLGGFIAMFVALVFLLSGNIFSKLFRFSAWGLSSIWQLFFLSLLIGGLFVSLFLQFLPYGTFEVSDM